jgi:hypothetical protein
MKQNAREQLLREIAHCENINVSRKLGRSHPCSSIVNFQNEQNFQLPEPWTGKLSEAPILFITSHPSIDIKEEFPTQDWSEDDILNFFTNRWDSKWVKRGANGKPLYPLLKTGKYRKNWVVTWAGVGKRAEELLGRAPVFGVDFAITAVVHCKSRKGTGVAEAAKECAEKYLSRIMQISPAKVIVAMGNLACDLLCNVINISCNSDYCRRKVGDIERELYLYRYRLKRSK